MSASTTAPGRQVVLRGGSPWGFRMHGGADTTQPLRISRVNPGSKAFDESVREGEVITSINGQPTIGLPNCEAHALIKAAGDTLQLTLSQDPSKRRPHKPAAAPPQPEHNTEKQTSETGEIKESKEYASEISLATQKTASTNKTKSQPPASHESPKSSSSHRVGGRQKRSRRLRARKLALQLDSLLHTPDAGLLPEPDWQQVDEQIAPLPPAVHAYPLVYAEAIVASDAASEQLVRLFQVHVATKQAKMQAKQRIKAETFPPSLRRLDVIREDEEAAQSIYEDVDLRGTQESLLSSDGEMVASDADEATLEFEKIMNLEEQNYEAYHSSSSDVDGDFGRCRSEDYEPVLVREGRLLVQQIRVQQCPGEEFEQICDAEELLDGRNIEAEFEEVCRQNSELIESPEPDNKENIEPRTKKSEVVLEIAKLNFLKTPFEDEIVTKTEIITLDSPRSSGKIPRALAAQLEENLEMLEREIEAENEQLRDVAARSAEIVDKFSAKLDEMNELINVSGSPVIMEQINEFAEQLIAAEDKSLFETNKDKLVSFIREASGMEAVHRPAKVQDESNLLRFLEQEPRTGDQEEQTLTSLEEVTRRLAQVLQNSLQNSPSPPPPAEANFDSSDNEAGKSGLSRTPVSLLARSRSASVDSNASQGTTIYVGSPCSSACSSGWTAGGGVVPSLRTLCVSAVGRLARGRELMLAWGLASAADLKISRPNLARRPVPPPPAPRWFPTGLGAIAVGLSPAQQRAEPQLTRERAALLLDLHCKFAQRRAYHEQRPLPAAPAAPAPSADAMGVDEASPDAEKMLQEWLQDELSIDESHTQSVMTTARKFEVDRYHISKQRDIAVEIQGQRQFRMLRQQMEQLEEERRQQEQLLDDEQQQMAPPVGADSPIAEQDPLQRLSQLESDATAAPTSMAAQEQAADGHGPGNNNNATSTPAGKMPSTVPSPSFKAKAPSPGVWSPKTSRAHPPPLLPSPTSSNNDEPPPPPVWTPKASPTLERKEFRPVRFEASTPPPRPPPCTQEVPPPFDPVATATISNFLDRKLTLDIPKLPRAQNPTVTLLQRAREGQLPKGATYLERTTMSASDQTQQQKETQAQQESASNFNPNDILYTVKREEEKEANKKVVQLAPIVYDGIGPTTKDGIPIVMRSNIKEENYGKWYKRMYDSLHKAGKDDDSITIRYRPSSNSRRGHGGYASEPEPSGEYDSDVAGGISSKYATLDRRRIKNKEADFTSTTMPRSRGMAPSIKYACEVYKNQPGRIEDYEPGRSSISEKEAKLHAAESQSTAKKQHMANALKDVSASDTQLVFKKRTESEALSPVEQKQVYKTIQSGGEVPLSGLRKLAPEKPKEPDALQSFFEEFERDKESPHKFVECGDVTIHYRSPVRGLARDAPLSEEELARRQEEAMRRIYQEERRRKYLQELHDIESRRHTDNFTPSQKSPIPLNRYDNFFEDIPSRRDRTPEPKMVARALYNFVGQSSRELTFRRGDIILVRRQIDRNWYEGEHNASVGLFPFNYVEIIPYDGVRTMPKGPSEGKARAKFNFVAQSSLELSLVKGEMVVLTRRVDDNWYEGRIGVRRGIFPCTYVEVINEPGERLDAQKPKLTAAYMNGSAPLTGQSYSSSKYLPYMSQTLHIDTRSDPIPYRSLYNYKPQNEDELELREGDTVFVMEKCDDGWYVGTSNRTGHFGTFPGNYVERI